jgi:hypothetical protein
MRGTFYRQVSSFYCWFVVKFCYVRLVYENILMDTVTCEERKTSAFILTAFFYVSSMLITSLSFQDNV